MMTKGQNVVASITLRHSYLKKLVFPKAVMQTHRHLLPPTLQGHSQQAGATLKSGNQEFSVTFSLGRSNDRLVLLETGWKDVVDQLGLKEGDGVTISLDDRASSTYLIKLIETVLAPVEGPQAEEGDIYQGGDDAHAKVVKFDLNKLPEESDEEEIN
ncbi:hypothetical protein SLEP1_g40323 [Rubroshorea leprosula]|uniref:TF-B3 domain-containing protein n=1 Tax=Rubroshorea leprosula TaxID=152421 RepID=A0AAV5L323_9ROSI|nr:hypothetical protein SLEP1_g40323 [Rubroshorea leprosula]